MINFKLLKKMSISIEDIEHLLYFDEINEFLEYISNVDIDKKFIVNLILLVFTKPNLNSPDWVKEIISIIEKDQFNTSMLAPNLRNIREIEIICNEFAQKIHYLNDNKEMYFNDYCITYDMFNEYLNVLYLWFRDNFDTD